LNNNISKLWFKETFFGDLFVFLQSISLKKCINYVKIMIVWAHGHFVLKNINQNFLPVDKNGLPLQRYPENNLFTLKKTNTY